MAIPRSWYVSSVLTLRYPLKNPPPPPPGLSGPHVPFENVLKINLDKLETKGNCSRFTLRNKRRLNH